jgi:hypothetical protein
MHRLVIVSGPNRGSSYALIDGENSIGRQMDNHIVLSSGKVSKRHCALLVTPKEVFLRDEGSTNGTFVNGTLVRKLPLKPGDKIGIGEFVLELSSSTMPAVVSADHSFPSTPMSSEPIAPEPMIRHEPIVEIPQDLPGKIKFGFEGKIMPFFYGTLMKNEYRSIVAVLFAVMVLVSVVGSIMPMSDLAEKSIQNEALIRAKVLAREVADRWAPAIAARAESQIDLSFIENEESVKMVAIVDQNLQIIAPQSRLNQILGGGREAAFAMMMAKEFKDGREKGFGRLLSESVASYIEPLKTTDPRQVKTQVSAMVVVSIDFSNNLLAAGGLGVAYGTGFVVAGLLAAFFYFVLMRLTMKPLEVLNDDLDQVLRGELPKVTHEFKVEELNPLWNNINSTVQRMSKGGASTDFSGGGDAMINWDNEFASVRALCEASKFGFMGVDTNLVMVAMNPQFEEVSGIRLDAIGQAVQQVARDQSLISLAKDLQERVQSSPSRSATDDFEFSGVAYQVIATGAGPVSQAGFAMVFKKKE